MVSRSGGQTGSGIVMNLKLIDLQQIIDRFFDDDWIFVWLLDGL